MADVDTPIEGNNPDAEGVDERPSWLPENFKSPEDLVKSYNEAQTKIRDQGTQINTLNDNYAALSTQIEEISAAQNRPDPSQVYSQWQDLYDQDPIGTMAQIAQATAQQILQQQSQQSKGPASDPNMVAFAADYTMAQQHQDWSDYKEKVGELIASNPLFQDDRLWADPQTASSTMNSAYEMVKAQDVLTGNAVVQQQAADTRAMKLAAQSAAGASGRTPAPDDYQQRWQEIMNAPSTKLGI